MTAPSAEDIVRLLRRLRVDLSNEKALQAGVAEGLALAGIAFEREKRLSVEDIPDFFLPGGLIIECKVKGKFRKIEVYRQLLRYAGRSEVSALILASNANMGLPEEMQGKPVYAASLSMGWCT